jgi:Sec-independent protein translocase protein TatA
MLVMPRILALVNLDSAEFIILLAIIVVLLGGARLPLLMRRMEDGTRNFHRWLRRDQVWQFNDGRQRQHAEAPPTKPRWQTLVLFSLAVLSLMIIGEQERLTLEKVFAGFGILAAVLLTWWFLFGRKRH